MPSVALPHPECVTERDGTGVAQEQATPEGDLGPVPGHPEASPCKHAARDVRRTALPLCELSPLPRTRGRPAGRVRECERDAPILVEEVECRYAGRVDTDAQARPPLRVG